ASHANSRADRTPFDQRRYHGYFLLCAQVVHTLIIRYRFRIAREKGQWSEEKLLLSLRLFHGPVLIPSGLNRSLRGCLTRLRGHRLKAALASDLTTPAAHLRHDLRDHRRPHEGFSSGA